MTGCGAYIHKDANCGDKEELTGSLYLCPECNKELKLKWNYDPKNS